MDSVVCPPFPLAFNGPATPPFAELQSDLYDMLPSRSVQEHGPHVRCSTPRTSEKQSSEASAESVETHSQASTGSARADQAAAYISRLRCWRRAWKGKRRCRSHVMRTTPFFPRSRRRSWASSKSSLICLVSHTHAHPHSRTHIHRTANHVRTSKISSRDKIRPKAGASTHL